MFFLMLQWIDDMFFTPLQVHNTCQKLRDRRISMYFLWLVGQFA
jgi:hypothetical protein